MTEWEQCLIIALIDIGFFCAGRLSNLRESLKWRTKWIELEHASARIENREPRNISEVE